ncbi:hypothetical protein AYI68_g2468 [Smittium mucronatum]|uniref:Uncharacterized protein n=1 Tax=Smittium mucronatum TaxID=133383 RepID=A0A1R0H2K3_9FUNG|nr:hypothetical protein AYI68_g2468 [Smittium mucronatum]
MQAHLSDEPFHLGRTNINAPELPPDATMPMAKPLCFSNHKAGADSDIFTINDEPRPNIIPCVNTNCHICVLNEANNNPAVAITVPIKLAFLIPTIFTKGLAKLSNSKPGILQKRWGFQKPVKDSPKKPAL